MAERSTIEFNFDSPVHAELFSRYREVQAVSRTKSPHQIGEAGIWVIGVNQVSSGLHRDLTDFFTALNQGGGARTAMTVRLAAKFGLGTITPLITVSVSKARARTLESLMVRVPRFSEMIRMPRRRLATGAGRDERPLGPEQPASFQIGWGGLSEFW